MQIEDNFKNVKKDDNLTGEDEGCKEEKDDFTIKDPSSIPLPQPTSRIEINRPPVKKKKRFIYYGLSIFFSFIVARLALIAISLYSLNFDKLILNNMKYDSAKHDSFTLDVSLSDTYSPLFIRIKDIDCDVFGVNKNNDLYRFFSLDVPDIEIIKYKTLRFIHDIKFKNINPKDILESNNTKAIKVKVRGKLCYRFCLMKFFLRFDLEKEIEIKNKENKVKWPIINNLDIKKEEDSIILNLNIDNSNFRLPYYVNITLAESLIKCSQDFPCIVKISEQKFGNGHFMTPLIIEIKIDKKDFERIGSTIFDLINSKDVTIGIESITTNEFKHQLGLQRQLSINDNNKGGKGDGSEKGGSKGNDNGSKGDNNNDKGDKTNPPTHTNTDPPTNTNTNPPTHTAFPYSLQRLEVIDNQIYSRISMKIGCIPFVTPETRINFEDLNLSADIELYDKIVGKGEVKIESNLNDLDLNFKIKISDLQGIYDFKNEYKKGIIMSLNFGGGNDDSNYKGDGSKVDGSKDSDHLNNNNNIHNLNTNPSILNSLFKDLKLIFDKRENITKIFLQFKSRKMILKKINHPINNNLDSPFYNFEHFFFSSFKSINFHSILSSLPPEGKPLILFKNVKPKINIKTDLGDLNLTFKFLNFKYFEKGFKGGLCVIGEFFPKMENFNLKKIKMNILGNELEINEYYCDSKGDLNNKGKSDNKGDLNINNDFLSLDLSYIQSTSLFNHIFKLILTFNFKNWFFDYFKNSFKFPKKFIQLNIYTKGVPLKDLKSNITVYNLNFKVANRTLEMDLGFYFNLNVIKNLMYGDAFFFSKYNLISTLISENINKLIKKKDDKDNDHSDNLSIIPKKIIMDLQLDGTEPKLYRNQYFNSYLGHFKIGIPKEVINSFLIKKINNLPKINLGFYGEEMMSMDKTKFNLNYDSDEDYKYLIINFEVNTEIFEKEGQFVEYEICDKDGDEGSKEGGSREIKDNKDGGSKDPILNNKNPTNNTIPLSIKEIPIINKTPLSINNKKMAITISKNDLISFFRIFFIKIFEIPEGDYVPGKVGFFVEHGDVKKNGNLLSTKAILYIYTKAIEDFFTKTISSILLKSKISKLPKYFEFNLKSKRLDLLNLNLNGKNENFVKFYVQDVICKSFFFIKYPSKIKIEDYEEHLRIVNGGNGSSVDGRDNEGSVDGGNVDGGSVEEGDLNLNNDNDPNLNNNNLNSTLHNNNIFNEDITPDEIHFSTGKLTFNGNVFLDHNFPSQISISKISHALPFIKFISSIMKEPSTYPPLIFFRLLPLDLAFELPFNFKIESKNNLEYEILIDDKSVIKERVLVDQGDDKYLHLSLQKAKIENAFDLLKMGNESIIKIILRQGENELVNFEFKLDESVKDYFELNFEEALGKLSHLLQNNQYKVYDLLGIKY